MPTGNENLVGAMQQGLRYCWDETIGYSQTTRLLNPNLDCSSFIWYCLYNNGFDVGQSAWYTGDMMQRLVNAGFTEYIWGVNVNTPQHGDIFVYHEVDPQTGNYNGHTFFYAENVYGYSDPTARTNTKAMLQHARIEASSSRTHGYQYPDSGTIPGDVNNPDQDGDYPRNGVGAYWEVWVHATSGSDPTSGSHTWHVFRWGGEPPGPIPPGPFPPGNIPAWLIKKIHDKNFTFRNTLD